FGIYRYTRPYMDTSTLYAKPADPACFAGDKMTFARGATIEVLGADLEDAASTPDTTVANAYFDLTVESDQMAVFLTITPGHGGDGVSLPEIQDALAQAGVVHGIAMAELEKAVQAGQCHELCIAQGTPAVAGSPTQFESLLDT